MQFPYTFYVTGILPITPLFPIFQQYAPYTQIHTTTPHSSPVSVPILCTAATLTRPHIIDDEWMRSRLVSHIAHTRHT